MHRIGGALGTDAEFRRRKSRVYPMSSKLRGQIRKRAGVDSVSLPGGRMCGQTCRGADGKSDGPTAARGQQAINKMQVRTSRTVRGLGLVRSHKGPCPVHFDELLASGLLTSLDRNWR